PVRIQIIESCAGLFKDDRPWIQPGQSIFVDVKLASGAFANGHVLKTIRVEVIELGEPAG
ncbi:MAG: hypothetical protein KDA33_13120, partial [Phycisphaerales bacterium]|nr:hypothetical protein [Phycisphaerales bacterium]